MSRALLVISASIPSLCLGLAAGWWLSATPADESTSPNATVDSSSVESAAPVVELTEAKLKAIGLDVASVTNAFLRPTRDVPGRLQYDDRRHIEVKAATDGVLTDVRVQPGDRVTPGFVVAVMSSPQVGTARADVLERKAELQVAESDRVWKQKIADGIAAIGQAIQSNATPEELQEALSRQELGAAREQLVTAYSRLRVAENAAAALSGNSEIVSGRIASERRGERDSARAQLEALLEQGRFEATRNVSLAEANVADAERRLAIAKETVRSLLRQDTETPVDVAATGDLSKVEIVSPLKGTVETRFRSTNERVNTGDQLFVLADVSTLWVAADLRERDWQALTLQPSDPLPIRLPFEEPRTREATVYFVGREVDPQTNAIPLVGELANTDQLLRPGMFCRVVVPVGETVTGLVVPVSAVQREGDERFVFVRTGERSFERVDVTVKISSDDRAVVEGALNVGDDVVTDGAFALKSELLLEGEE